MLCQEIWQVLHPEEGTDPTPVLIQEGEEAGDQWSEVSG